MSRVLSTSCVTKRINLIVVNMGSGHGCEFSVFLLMRIFTVIAPKQCRTLFVNRVVHCPFFLLISIVPSYVVSRKGFLGGVKTIPCPLDVDESRSSEEVAVLPTKVSVWQDGEAAMVDTTPKLPLALDPPEVISGACRYAFRKRKSNVSYVYKYGKAKPQRGKASTATEKDEKGGSRWNRG